MDKKLVSIGFIAIQYVLIFLLTVKIGIYFNNKSKKNIKGLYVSRISKKEVSILSGNNRFKYYYELIPNSRVTFNPDWLKEQAIHTINADGFHDRFDYSLQKLQENYRIITIGDSFTYGSYIDTKDNWTEILEDKLVKLKPCKKIKKFEVINGGMHGFDAEFTIERLINKGLKYNPDLVIWFLHGWNLDRVNEISIGLQEKKEYDSYELLKNDVYKELKEKYHTDIISYEKKVLDRLSRNYKGELLIVSFKDIKEYPDGIELIKYLLDKDTKYDFFDSLLDYWHSDSIRMPDDHPNKAGHIKIAENLYEYLSKYISCQ